MVLLALNTGEFAYPGSSDPESLNRWWLIVREVRLPRVLLGVLCGAALSSSGAMLQGLFRNPLADPSLIGVSAGAAMGAVTALMIGVIPLAPAAFFGGLVATSFLHRSARFQGRTHLATMLLMGLAINALAGAYIGFLLWHGSASQTRDYFFWTLGSLVRGQAAWHLVFWVVPFVLLPWLYLPRLAPALNALALGEAEAGHLGFNVRKVQNVIIFMAASMVAVTVAACGIVGFVGLVVPHMIRLILGPDHRWLLPGSALGGAVLLVGADTLLRGLPGGEELPLGVLTALIGAPFFVGLVLTARERIWNA